MADKKKRRRGAPSKYTPETVARIVEGLKSHQGHVRSAENAGITYTTFKAWVNDIPTFSAIVKEADEQGLKARQDYALMCIVNAMKKQWQAGAWLLERTNPAMYALTQRHQLTGRDGAPIATMTQTVDLSNMTFEQILELAKQPLQPETTPPPAPPPTPIP